MFIWSLSQCSNFRYGSSFRVYQTLLRNTFVLCEIEIVTTFVLRKVYRPEYFLFVLFFCLFYPYLSSPCSSYFASFSAGYFDAHFCCLQLLVWSWLYNFLCVNAEIDWVTYLLWLSACILVWWHLWNFIVRQVKFIDFYIQMNILKGFFDIL